MDKELIANTLKKVKENSPKKNFKQSLDLIINLNSEVILCSDIRELLYNFNFTDFVDYSLSSGYKSELVEYISLFNKIILALTNSWSEILHLEDLISICCFLDVDFIGD